MSRSFSEITNEFPGYDDLLDQRTWVPLNLRESLPIIHIIGICCSMLAFQVAYSVEFSLGTPMMDALGFDSVVRSLIWLSGPLSGFIVQPMVGFASDRCRSKMGRRRPYILGGFIGILVGLLILYFIDTIQNKILAKTLFIIGFFGVNIAINILQGPSRTLIGDIVPQSQQVLANTIGSIMLGLAAIVTNLIGGLRFLATLLHTTSTDLVFISGMILICISSIITLICAKEEQLQMGKEPDSRNPFVSIFNAFKTMPRPVFRISLVYFFSWMAYFPFNIECTDFFASDVFKGINNPDDPKYESYLNGLSFGMIVLAVSNGLVLIYSPFQEALIKKIGLRISYALSQIIEAVCLIAVILLSILSEHANKWILLGLLAPLGISATIFNSIPFAIVGLNVSQDQMGVYMGVLNMFGVVGQQISNFILVSGVGKICERINPELKSPIIGGGAFFAIVAAILCRFIIIPNQDTSIMEPLTPGNAYYD